MLTFGLFFINLANAQNYSPTLSFGLDRVLFGSTPLDADILASIIAEKQDDLKKRIVEKEILSPLLSNSSFVTKNFLYSLVKNLMNEKDKNILKKEIMEHTSNYALVYTLAEMYLQMSWNELKNGTYLDSIHALPYPKNEKFTLNTEVLSNVHSSEFIQQKLALSDSLLFQIERKDDKTLLPATEYINFNNLLLDMIFQAVRSNPTFLAKGFSQKPLYFSVDQYRTHSCYHQLSCLTLKEKMYLDVKNFIDAVGELHTIFGDLIVYLEVQESLGNPTPTVVETSETATQVAIGIQNDSLVNSENINLPTTGQSAIVSKSASIILMESVENVKNEMKLVQLKGLQKDRASKEMLEDYYFLLYSIQPTLLPLEAKNAQERISSFFLPKISVLNLQQDHQLNGVIEQTMILSKSLENHFQKPILEALSNKSSCRQMQSMLTQKKDVIHLYLAFFSRLDELDKTETYYYLLKNLSMCGDQMKDEHSAKAMNVLLNSIDKYTTFETEEDRISIDVESIITSLFEQYGSRDKNPVHFYLTMGANNSFRLKHTPIEDRPNEEANFAYVAEKLGIRFNLINWEMRNAYGSRQEKSFGSWLNNKRNTAPSMDSYQSEPVISNLHVLLYGSGLVSRFVHLTNSKASISSYLGTGLGLTFFNNLSVNTSLLLPIQSNNRLEINDLAINIGFDVYFAQYIAAMNKKHREIKQAKLDLEKYKIQMEYRTKELEMELRQRNQSI